MDSHPHPNHKIEDPPAEDLIRNNGDPKGPSSTSTDVNNEKPAKRPTRQWAAWTHQEEENFFNALRQVGKNFEKITCRVQSKNKNQVRHYYYRLVRRMNKLLGPALCLDAGNSKDTIAAMLRWWSLLEKHSCTASKLHLKPRRFKMFLEALENQLLKDRNKSKRKRPCVGEKYLTAASTSSITCKAPGYDSHPVNGTHNTAKLEATKGPSSRRNTIPNINPSKGNLPAVKAVRQKRRPGGLLASAAYRRWEKAAMAGVSLVADAAEQLERVTNDGNYSVAQGTSTMPSNGQKDVYFVGDSDGRVCSPNLTAICSHQTRDAVIQPSMKLKLQLFPVNEVTRQALEKDSCNPHLELTLSGRKRISSILEHLNRKWGSSSIASGELMLFPYNTELEDASQQRWTIKDTISAADVHATVGNPAVFRLRYGWLSHGVPVADSGQVPSPVYRSDIGMHSKDSLEGFDTDVLTSEMPHVESSAQPGSYISGRPSGSSRDSPVASLSSPGSFTEAAAAKHQSESNDEIPNSSTRVPLFLDGGNTYRRAQEEVSSATRNRGTVSAGEWADSLTNISIGDLLTEASKAAKSSCIDSSQGKLAPCPQDTPFSSDSFDAAIAAHISGISTPASPTSIWNAEETCDEFSFKTAPALKSGQISSCQSIEGQRHSDSSFQAYLKELSKSGSPTRPSENHKVESGSPQYAIPEKNNNAPPENVNLMDIYWPDSLGPLELEVPFSSRYQGQDVVFGDSNSFGCLSRMIASSLDAFQNCSFFGMDKRDSPRSEAQGTSRC